MTTRITFPMTVLRMCLALVLLAAVTTGNTRSRQKPTARQSASREFDFARYETFLENTDSEVLNLTQVFREATELMHSLTQTQKNASHVDVVGTILYRAFYDVNEDFFDLNASILVSQLMKDARENLLALPINNDAVFEAVKDLQIAVLRTDDSFRDPIVALCSPRGSESPFDEIQQPRFNHGSQLPYDRCYFALTLRNTKLLNSKIAIVAYPDSFVIRPLPSIAGHHIVNNRVVDVAIEAGSRGRRPSEDTLLSLFFQPSLTGNTSKGCASWSKTLDDWTTDGCRVDLNLCHCNLSALKGEDPTGGQFIVYDYLDVLINEASYEYVREFKNYEHPTEAFFAEASALMHNISLFPASPEIMDKLHGVFAGTMDASYELLYGQKTNLTKDHINTLYLDMRKILSTPFEWRTFNAFTFTYMYFDVALAVRVIENPSDFESISFGLYQLSTNVTFIHSNQTDSPGPTFEDPEFIYALQASDSVAKYNKQVAYMVLQVNQYIFADIEPDDRYQVHNFRVVDVTLVPRDGVEANEDQFIDIGYRPTVFNASAKNVRLGCAYWSDRDFVWTTEGCVVHDNASPRGCRCNLSAHFDEKREGGQYVVYEFSDVILDYDRIRDMLNNPVTATPDNNEQVVGELTAFVHNMTEIGYLDDESVRWTRDAALRALADEAAKSTALAADLRVVAGRWARDSNYQASFRYRDRRGSRGAQTPVALDADQVLSNRAVQQETSLLHEMALVVLRLSPRQPRIGVKVTETENGFWNRNYSRASTKPQFSFYLSALPADQMHVAAIMYPESKSFVPLTHSLPAVFSYHVLELAIISEDDDVSPSDRLVTMIHVPDLDRPRSTASLTACATWTGADWSAQTCWPEPGVEHACTCNLSAHALAVGTFLPLLVYEAPEVHNFSPKASLGGLDILYVISSTLSLFGLVFIGLTAVVFPKWRADVGHKILLHLSLALFLYQTLRLVRETHHVYTALNRGVGAFVAFAAVTHYSRLAHYAWMLAMSVLQMRRLLTVVGAVDTPHLLLKVSALAWGLPLLPLAALLSWDLDAHFARPDTLTHLVLYLVPGVAVTLINIVLFAIIAARMFGCCGWGKVEDLERHGLSRATLTGRRMAMLTLLFFLFGTPTVFETFNDLWGHSVVLEVLFKVFDPVRGAVVFVYFVLLNRTTLGMWRRKFRRLTAGNVKWELPSPQQEALTCSTSF